jgi:hypothetical protein
VTWRFKFCICSLPNGYDDDGEEDVAEEHKSPFEKVRTIIFTETGEIGLY